MDKKLVVKMFESLSSEIRLDIFRLLMKHADSGLVAGEIAEALELPNTNLSFHLKALVHADMIDVAQEGRFLRYKAKVDQMQFLINFLTAECCDGQPEQCFKKS